MPRKLGQHFLASGPILERIARRAQLVGRRPEEVTLVAVSKYQPLERIQELYTLGQRAFAENRVQSLLERREALPMPDIRWHLIGHLQRNKARVVVPFPAGGITDSVTRLMAQKLSVALAQPVVIEKQKDIPQLSRFAIRDSGTTVAAGMCIDLVKKA